MIKTPQHIALIARLSLSFLWLFTAATSFWWARNIGYEVLSLADIHSKMANVFINLGSLLDAAIGVWLLSNKQLKWCYRFQIILIISYSLLLTLIAPSFWLHPFGPVTKNIPILVLIYWLSINTRD
jgi:hypothetical protein